MFHLRGGGPAAVQAYGLLCHHRPGVDHDFLGVGMLDGVVARRLRVVGVEPGHAGCVTGQLVVYQPHLIFKGHPSVIRMDNLVFGVGQFAS